MPTQPEIDDVLTKVATLQAARVVNDAAQLAVSRAYAELGSHQSLWETAIARGETDAPTLTALLNNVLDATTSANALQETANTASQAMSTASSAIANAIDGILHPPDP